MSTLSVTTINTANGTTNLSLATGNSSGPSIALNADVNGIFLKANSSANAFIANSTTTVVAISSANALIANTSTTSIAVNGSTELLINSTASVFNGTVADSTGTFRPLVSGTSVASTSNTVVDFTGIPSWAKRITVMFNGVSVNGTATLQIQLGISSGFETTGYLSQASTFNNSPGGAFATTGLLLTSAGNAAGLWNGIIPICLISTNSWVTSGVLMTSSGTAITTLFAGSKTLAGTLDRVRITTTGTDTFDAGSINIMYE